MYVKYLLVLLILLFFNNLTAQDHAGHVHENEHEHEHEHPLNEIGFATNAVLLGSEGEFAFGVHLHYLRAFEDSKFGAGIGYEQIFDEHSHRILGIIGSYRPIEPLFLDVSPGIIFPEDADSNYGFGLHLEATYEFSINSFHIGPAIGFASDFDEYHISAGLHFAFGF